MFRIDDSSYIDGQWRRGRGAELSVESPSTGELVAELCAASVDDLDDALQAAARAASSWAAVGVDGRLKFSRRLHSEIAERADTFADLVTLEQGSPAPLNRRLHVDVPLAAMQAMNDAAATALAPLEVGNSTVHHEPLGVVAALTPWNVPVHQAVIKVVSALLAGNTVVFKPSELTPLTALELARAIDAAGFPAGVFNLVIGDGPEVGAALVSSAYVDAVSFTGSTAVGRGIAEQAARHLTRVRLELGGKSPSVVLSTCDDVLLETAVKVTVADCLLNAGQTCTALSRLIVPRGRLEQVEAVAAAAASKHVPGQRMGPLISGAQLERVSQSVAGAIASGERVVYQGDAANLPGAGHYMHPVIFSDVDASSPLAKEEIFGPVLTIMPVDSDEEAIALANDTVYGLTSAVWSAEPEAATRAARAITAGQVSINGASFNVEAPFGGRKQSGLGRELGVHGLLDMTEPKAVQR